MHGAMLWEDSHTGISAGRRKSARPSRASVAAALAIGFLLALQLMPADASAGTRTKRAGRATEQIYLQFHVRKTATSPNGTEYATYHDEIWAVQPNGRGLRRIKRGAGGGCAPVVACQKVVVSPDGRYLYCRCSGRRHLAILRMKPDGSGARKLFDLSGFATPGDPGGRWEPSDILVSGVGTIAYAYRGDDGVSQIEVMQRGGKKRSVHTTANPIYNPRISPDGRMIVFGEGNASDPYFYYHVTHIQLLDLQTGSLRTVHMNLPPTLSGNSAAELEALTCANPYTTTFGFSADSSKLIFRSSLQEDTCKTAGPEGFHIFDVASGALEHFFVLPRNGANAVPSPNGSRFAFVRYRSPKHRVVAGLFVINRDGSGLRRILRRRPILVRGEALLTWGKALLDSRKKPALALPSAP